MSTFKTVLTTTAVLLLGTALSAGIVFVHQQQQQISDLQLQIVSLQAQVTAVQNRTLSDESRLHRTIKTTNKNFDTVEKQQDQLRDALGLLITALTGDDSNKEKAPTSFNRNNSSM